MPFRSNHKHRKLSVPQDFRVMADHMTVPRLYMELFAVVCIETSHYVTFVKAGSGPDAPWCFFDSMADRKGNKTQQKINATKKVVRYPLHRFEAHPNSECTDISRKDDKVSALQVSLVYLKPFRISFKTVETIAQLS